MVLPDVVGERSSQRVLTLTYEPGDSLMDIDELGYTQVERNRLGYALFRAMARQLFEFEAIHADPNPANFRMQMEKSSSTTLGVLSASTPTLESLTVTSSKQPSRQWDDVEDALRRLGVRNLEGGQPPYDFCEKWRIFGAPFYPGAHSTSRILASTKCSQACARISCDPPHAFKPSSEMVFIDRVVAGHYGNLCKIGCNAEFGPLLKEYAGFVEPS